MDSSLARLSVAIVVSTLAWKYIIYPLFFSPLASIPAAHPLAHFTSLWIEWHRLRGTDFQKVSEAFATKGPHLRLGPRDIAVNDIESVSCVWGAGVADFDKHPSYVYWKTQGMVNTFTSVLGPEHRRRHRRIRGVHKRSYIASSPHIRAIMSNLMVERLLPLFGQVATSSNGTVNILPVAQAIIMDCTSAFAFGVPLSLNFITDAAARYQWFELFKVAFPNNQDLFWLREHPHITRVLRFLGIPVISGKIAGARREFESWALPKVDAAEEVMQRHDRGQPVALGEFPVLYDAIRSDLVPTNNDGAKASFTMTPHQRRELASECLDHIAFTAEAFGTVFAYIIYELSRHPDIQSELRAELRAAENPLIGNGDAPIDVPASETLERLPFLGAVVKECLRLRNTSPNADPRVTPSHPCRIGPLMAIPPKTRVCSYGWCLHRNPDVYADPLTWNPRRWLPGGSDDPALAKKWFFAFGAGSRNCIGQHLAVELMRMSLATVYTNYATSIANETEYPGANKPMSSDLVEKLIVKFEKVSLAEC
ncbi:cytochrome P450 [Xylaria palmicola]|nr:cytochrome P450 [Xylaria palmicola]